jgi:hypothetical protein
MNAHEKIVTWQTDGPHVVYSNAPWQSVITVRCEKETVYQLKLHACCPVHMAEEIATGFTRIAQELPAAISKQKELGI